MNHSFYETRAREKVNDAMREGLRSQAYHRSGLPKLNLLHGLKQRIQAFLDRKTSKKDRPMQKLKPKRNPV